MSGHVPYRQDIWIGPPTTQGGKVRVLDCADGLLPCAWLDVRAAERHGVGDVPDWLHSGSQEGEVALAQPSGTSRNVCWLFQTWYDVLKVPITFGSAARADMQSSGSGYPISYPADLARLALTQT